MSLSTGRSISQEVLLAGAALKHTFLGLSAGTGYTVSVTAATDAGLGREAAITAATVAMPQSLEAAISVPSMYSVYGPCVCNAVQLCYTVLYCMYGSEINYHTCIHFTTTVAGSVFGVLTIAVLVLALCLCVR